MDTTKTELKLINPTISKLLSTLSVESEQIQNRSYDCELCEDSGRIFVTEETNGKIYNAVKKCVCVLEKLRNKRLAVIPPNFTNADLATLRAKPELHPEQVNTVKEMKNNPGGNYFLAGDFGTGKTLFLWTLYREVVMSDVRRVVVCTLSELLNEYRQFIQASMNGGELVYPRLSAEDLRQTHTKYSIFIDDIDKARPTEYTAEQLFELSDAIYAYKHQIIVTTNLSLAKLIDHFKRADERFGGAIVRRLTNDAFIAEMF